jgi:hypothetical protein
VRASRDEKQGGRGKGEGVADSQGPHVSGTDGGSGGRWWELGWRAEKLDGIARLSRPAERKRCLNCLEVFPISLNLIHDSNLYFKSNLNPTQLKSKQNPINSKFATLRFYNS